MRYWICCFLFFLGLALLGCSDKGADRFEGSRYVEVCITDNAGNEETLCFEIGESWESSDLDSIVEGKTGKFSIKLHLFPDYPKSYVEKEGAFIDGLIEGRVSNYVFEKRKRSLVSWETFERGIRNGEFRYQNPETGICIRKGNFKDGALSGKTHFYYQSGEKLMELNYKQGVLTGCCREFDRAGSVVRQGYFEEGELVSGEFVRYFVDYAECIWSSKDSTYTVLSADGNGIRSTECKLEW